MPQEFAAEHREAKEHKSAQTARWRGVPLVATEVVPNGGPDPLGNDGRSGHLKPAGPHHGRLPEQCGAPQDPFKLG